MTNQEYQPKNLALMLTDQCPAECGHCIVESGPHGKNIMEQDLICRVIGQAWELGFSQVFLYGGEPFLRIHDTLPYAIEMTYKYGLFPSVGTNGFWGKTEKMAQDNLGVIDAIAAQYDRIFPISLSVDEYHEKFVPPESIARIIKEVRFGHYDHIRLKIQTLTSPSSFEALERLYDACMEVGIELIKTDRSGVYPTLPQEFIEVIPENNPQIANLLNCPEDRIEELVALKSSTEDERSVIEMRDDRDGYERRYFIFPEQKYIIPIYFDSVINAGRAQVPGTPLEFGSKNAPKGEFIFIAPNARAYAYPAQVPDQIGAVLYIDNLKGTISWVRGKLEELGIG